ncbi:TPA: hypothetical protein RVU01_005364 [Escherichia coli]|nr:hypothetical protein [Escherichia coli]
MNINDYQFHRLEFRHCVAFAKTLMCIIDTLSSKQFRKDNDLFLKKNRVSSSDIGIELYVDICIDTEDSTRAGCIGSIDTHCFTWNPNTSQVRIDYRNSRWVDLSTESDLESAMFQLSLIHNPNELLYIITFSYLLQNYDNPSGFFIESDIEEIMEEFPSLKDILEEKDFYEDFRDLYDMHLELFKNG